MTFYGTKRYEIESISSERTNYREPAVQEKVDDGNCTPQSGVTGFDITVTRVFSDLYSGAETPAGELPHQLRGRGGHPLRAAAGADPGAGGDASGGAVQPGRPPARSAQGRLTGRRSPG